jgi:Na+-translocating ferredoxin:NAD+ oxidoreductase RnfD subunit
MNLAFIEKRNHDMTKILAAAALLGASFVATGCTTNERTVGGAVVGGAGGAVVGNAIGGTGGAVVGGVGGAVAGGAIGRNM